MKHFVYSLIALLQIGFLYSTAQVGFNRNGFVTNIPNNSFLYHSVALQADGKIIAVGQTDLNNGNQDGLIARFNVDGNLDTTFNNRTGFINTEGNTNSFSYYSVAVQPDGKIIAVGQTDDQNGNQDGLIARFNVDGNLDTTFNNPHGFITNIPNNSSTYNSVALQPDGKIIAVGRTDGGDGLIARFNTDGTLDRNFNGTGLVTNIPNNSFTYHSVVLQADGKIIAVGKTDNDQGLIARFNADGAPDIFFGNNGFITNVPNDSFVYNSVALQADGKIVVVGRAIDENMNAANELIVRFNSDGTLDTTFFNAPHGFITNAPNNFFTYNSVALQADGKIIAVGRTDGGDGLIARFNTDGTLDRNFNGTGLVTNILNNSFTYHSVVLQADEKIIAVGGTDGNNGLIARFLSNGVLDAESNWNLKNFRESKNINNVSIGLLG